MALKDLLVCVEQSQGALLRLRLAANLARRHDSRLTALYVQEGNPGELHHQNTAEFGLIPANEINRTSQTIRKSIDDTTSRLRSALAAIEVEFGLETELRCLGGVASAVVIQHARFADLCLVSPNQPIDASSIGYSFSEELLFAAGRPILFIPESGSFETLGRHILVAWNSSRASARAVNDALSLIERAEHTTVLSINPMIYVERYHSLPPERIVAHLKRHNVSVEGISLSNIHAYDIAGALHAEAHKVGADLIVAGAYGHPKVWEKLMGGVTRDLLAQMTLPVLMSY